MRVTVPVCALAFIASVAASGEQRCEAVQLFWGERTTNTIQRMDTTTQVVTPFASIGPGNHTFFVDQPSAMLYYASAAGGTISRLPLIGPGPSQTIISGLAIVRDIAVDPVGQQLYWIDQGTGKIQRSALDGTGIMDVVSGISEPYGIALDPTDGRVYWTEGTTLGGTDRIMRARLDGSDIEQLVLTGGDGVHDIILDSVHAKLYWTLDDPGPVSRIETANLNGSGRMTVLAGPFISDYRHLALDTSENWLYFDDMVTPGAINRFNLSNSSFEVLSNSGAPHGLAIWQPPTSVPEPTTVVLGGLSLTVLGLMVMRRQRLGFRGR